jgi:N-acetyl-alpha-D-muramate 1-phosphate uridylyltransferase
MLPLAILAGGYATRLGLLTAEIPKSLIQINGRPFVDWQLELLIMNGYSDFVFCVSYKSDAIQDYLGDGKDRGVRIQYSLDGPTQLGTGGAVQNALPQLGKMFGVIYGDSYLPTNYLAAEEGFLSSSSQALMTVYKNQNQFDSSNVEFVNGKLINYEKGTKNENMRHIDYGITFFREVAFHPWRDQSAFDLADVCLQLAKESQLDGFEVFERFYEIGSIQGIEELSQYLRELSNEL